MKRLIMVSAMTIVYVCAAWAVEVGTKAPAFDVESGAGAKLSLSGLHGKNVVVLYETKDVIEENRPLKSALTELFDGTPAVKEKGVVIPVINCSSASVFTKGIWKNNLKKNSVKENITIYGDWDGQMAADYGMRENSSNVVVIDSGGTVRYSRAGKLSAGEIDAVKALLSKLVK